MKISEHQRIWVVQVYAASNSLTTSKNHQKHCFNYRMRPKDLQDLKYDVNSIASKIDEQEIHQLFNKSPELLSE